VIDGSQKFANIHNSIYGHGSQKYGSQIYTPVKKEEQKPLLDSQTMNSRGSDIIAESDDV